MSFGLVVKDYDDTNKILLYEANGQDVATFGAVRQSLAEIGCDNVDLYVDTPFDQRARAPPNAKPYATALINDIRVAVVYAKVKAATAPTPAPMMPPPNLPMPANLPQMPANAQLPYIVFNVAGGAGGNATGGSVVDSGNATNSVAPISAVASSTADPKLVKERVTTSKVVKGTRHADDSASSTVPSSSSGNFLAQIQKAARDRLQEKYKDLNTLLSTQNLEKAKVRVPVITRLMMWLKDGGVKGKTQLGKSTFKSWLVQNRIDREKGARFWALLLGNAYENASRGTKNPLTVAYADAKNGGGSQEPSQIGLDLVAQLNDDFFCKHFMSTGIAGFYDEDDAEGVEPADTPSTAATTMPSTTTPNVTASYKSSTLPATSDSALDGVDVNEQRKIEADIKRAKAAAATPAKAAAATPAKAARPGQEESGVVKKKRKLRRKSGKRSDDDDDEEEYKDKAAEAAVAAIAAAGAAAAVNAAAGAAAGNAAAGAGEGAQPQSLSDDNINNKPALVATGNHFLALDLEYIEAIGGGAAAAASWLVNGVALATHLKSEDEHVRAMRCRVIRRDGEPLNLITLQPMLNFGVPFDEVTMQYSSLMMHVIATIDSLPPAVNSHVLAAFKNANGTVTDTLYTGVVIKKGTDRSGPRVLYVDSKEEKCISVQHLVVIKSGSNPFGIKVVERVANE